MGDLSTIDGLSVFGDDLDLNMQRAYSSQQRKESQEETKYKQDWDDDFDESEFGKFESKEYEEEKIPKFEEEKDYFIQPDFEKRMTYPIAGSMRGNQFEERRDMNLSSWKSAMNESIDLVNNDDEFSDL